VANPTGVTFRRVYKGTGAEAWPTPLSGGSSTTQTHAWRGWDRYYGTYVFQTLTTTSAVRDGLKSDIGSGSAVAMFAGTPSTHLLQAPFTPSWLGVGDNVVGRTWETAPTATSLQFILDALNNVEPGPLAPEWETPFEDWPLPEAPPAVPVPIPSPAPAPTPTPEVEPSVDPNEGEQGWFDILGNRIGGFFDNLGSLIGSAFGWLGDLLSDLFGWLVDRLWEMFEWLFNGLEGLIEWLGSLLHSIWLALQILAQLLGTLLGAAIDLLSSMVGLLGDLAAWLANIFRLLGTLLGSIVDAVLSIPSLILDGLEWLFIPTGDYALPACDATFPCNWIQEAADAAGELQAGVSGHGSCVAPSFGWSEFSAQAPAPPGCSGASSAGASQAGDLFGWRTPLRAVLTLGLWLGFVRKALALAPWAREGDMPLAAAEVTV
jgi:hypothetical protein